MERMAGLSDEEKAKKIEEVKQVCRDFCGVCPSYAGTGEKDYGFCATGRAHAISVEDGCICESCPITDGLSLRWEYYCTRGSGREQAAQE